MANPWQDVIIRDDQLNYLWPQYSLPGNNFFGRIRATPYYLQSQLTALAAREVHSPLTFDARPEAALVNPAVTHPKWDSDALSARVLRQNASKVFIGQHFNNHTHDNGFEYQYNFDGALVTTSSTVSTSGASTMILGLNLANGSALTTNRVAYIDANASSENPCQPGNGFYNSLSGSVTIGSQTASLANAIPYSDKSNCCTDAAGNCLPLTSSTPFYSVEGNRLYVAVNIPAGIASGRQNISYSVTVRVVEGVRPIQNALAIL